MKKYTLLVLFFILLSCKTNRGENQRYKNQIGDTHFNEDLDNSNFKFCDSTNVLHKRSFVNYDGGMKAVEEDILEKYEFKPSYTPYSGYFIIRFAVNCNNESGRFRMQTLDTNFNLSKFPDELEKHILSIVKELKNWKHAFYEGKDYDCYRFLTIKIINGQIK